MAADRSKTPTQESYDQQQGPLFTFWRLNMVTDEVFGQGVAGNKKRAAFKDTLYKNLLYPHEQKELEKIEKDNKGMDLFLDAKGKDVLRDFLVSIALKRNYKMDNVVHSVYEGSEPPTLAGRWRFWNKELKDRMNAKNAATKAAKQQKGESSEAGAASGG
jgi:hypothetical protein